MSVATVGDMLERAQDFEKRLEAYYADLRDRTTVDGVRLLTYYLARRKRHIPEALKVLSERRLTRIRQIPLKYDDTNFEPARCFQGKRLSDSASADELLEVAIQYVELLCSFYRWLTFQPLCDEAAALFQNLLKIEERDIIELKKIKATHYF